MLEENIPAEYEILSFLVRAWSGNNQAKVVQLEGEELKYKGRFSPFRSQLPATVYIGKYRDASIMPGTEGLERWRLFRYLTFHEALHLLYTKDVKWIKDHVTEAVFNILEDCRIEKLGIREYKGYQGEKLYATAYGYLQRPKVRGLHTREQFLEALLQLSYAGRVKGHLAPWDKRYRALREFASKTKALETFEEVVELAKEVSTYLQGEYGPAKVINWNWSWLNPEREDEFHGSEILKVAEAIAGKRIPRSIATSTLNIRREYEKIRSEGEAELGNGLRERVRVVVPEEKRDYWSLMDGTQVLQRIMKSRLQRWRIGWEERLDEAGDELDVEELIAGKLRDRRVFYDEEKLTSRSKILILLDLSTSISSQLQRYKQATGVICEVLNSLGARFAVYGYYRDEFDKDGSVLLKVKDINQGWSEPCRRRLASLQASGSTPTGTVLLAAQRYMAKNDIGRVVLITDGLPEPACIEVPLTLRAVRELKKFSKVYFLGIADFSTLRAMRHSIERFRPNRCEVIFDLNQLPKVFFRLLKERS